MISVTHFRAGAADFEQRARDALAVLAARPGFVRGDLGRSTDDPADWTLVTEWANVGSYRRALGNYEVKLRATPLLGEALDLPSAFEALVTVDAAGAITEQVSDRNAADTLEPTSVQPVENQCPPTSPLPATTPSST